MLRTTTVKQFACPIDGCQQLFSGKYKLRILWHLEQGPLRYGEIRRRLTDATGLKSVTPRVLSRELKLMSALGLLAREDFNVVPKRVEYRLTPLGRSFLPAIESMVQWGIKHVVRDSVLRKAGLA